MTSTACTPIPLRLACAFACFANACAGAADAVAPKQHLEKVEIQGEAATDSQVRQSFVAGKLVISRKSIEDSGQPNAYEVLKREPAVTVAADGRLGLLGLPGYTQVLVDGRPPPPGRSPFELDVVHIERIEIVKGAMAEYGPFGIAGTINIVTRQVERKRSTSLSTTGTAGNDTAQARAAWSTTTRPADESWALSHRISALRRQANLQRATLTEAAGADGILGTVDQATAESRETLTQWNASSSYTRKWSATTDLEMAPSLALWRSGDDADEWHRGAALAPWARSTSSGTISVISLPLRWKQRFSGGSAAEISAESSRTSLDRRNHRIDQFTPGSPNLDTQHSAEIRSRLAHQILRLQFTTALADAHDLKVGGSLARSDWRDTTDARVNGAPDPAFAPFGNQQRRAGPQHTAFIQDEWTISERWAATAGLSAAWRRVRIQEGTLQNTASYRVASPSLHVAHKLDTAGQRKLRLSLDRSFQAPDTEQYMQRPVIHPLAPCAPQGACPTNPVQYADRAGNPALQPERALGMTLGYEHYLGRTSMLGVDVFRRRLNDVVGQVVAMETVPWAASPRHVMRPINLGTAWVQGLSLDARLAANELDSTWPRVNLRAGLTLASSRLRTVPGPDNRMADQSPWAAKLGVRYKFIALPLEVSADANWRPGLWYRTAANRQIYQGRREDVSSQAAWTISRDTTLRLTLNNMLSTDLHTVEAYGLGTTLDARTSTHKRAGTTAALTVDLRL